MTHAVSNLVSGLAAGYNPPRLAVRGPNAPPSTHSKGQLMPVRVTLDAMIPREDFGMEGEEFVLDLFPGFPISSLVKDAPIQKLLRKPDFQRETNHWSPDQLATFIASFLDNEVIPSLILW